MSNPYKKPLTNEEENQHNENFFFDPSEELNMTQKGKLPHCHQDYTYQCVTFRLADSLPRELTEDFRFQMAVFREEHPLPWDNTTKHLYSSILGPMQERLLENGYGSCALADPNLRRILIGSIHFKDNQDYEVIGYVIMPNHVHLAIRPFEKKLEKIMKSIKGYSGLMINRAMKKKGDFWMKESFDRMARSEKDLWRFLRYIRDNPKNLPTDSYTLFFKEGFDPRHDRWDGRLPGMDDSSL